MIERATGEAKCDRFCDLVMKGGITSGIVYPRAITEFSRHYQFHSIGGTSAGAIAAAVTAAAEYQRRCFGNAGFALLEKLPDQLKEKVDGAGNSKLLSLFQPQAGPGRLFSILLLGLNRKGTWTRVLSIVIGALRAYWPAVALSILVAFIIARTGHSWLAAVLSFQATLLVSVAAWLYRDITRVVTNNGFGLCTGMSAKTPKGTTKSDGHEALTPWLHRTIQAAAGRAPGGSDPNKDPLTFGDLHGAPGYPLPWVSLQTGKPVRSIDLRVVTTNLSHGRPYTLPFDVTDPANSKYRARERFFYKEVELARYLPPDVLAYMVLHSDRYAVAQGRDGKDPPLDEHTGDLLEIPEAQHFPVLLAARMSLSFPLLLSAVPLWAIDFDSKEGARTMKRCWFSDGGICSNFPVHMFDGLLPAWPTFAINLEDHIPSDSPCYLPSRYQDGHGERWNRFAEGQDPARQMGGFLRSIVTTMQNWNDNTLSRMPGVRDRVARVRLKPHEGGMNLNMAEEDIDAIAQRGLDAAKSLVSRFNGPSNRKPLTGWDEHRGLRLNVLVSMLRDKANGLRTALDRSGANPITYDDLVDQAVAEDWFVGYEGPFTPQNCKDLKAVVAAIDALVGALTVTPPSNSFRSFPEATLRVRPPA